MAELISLDSLPEDTLGISLISGMEDLGKKPAGKSGGGGGGKSGGGGGLMNLESLDVPVLEPLANLNVGKSDNAASSNAGSNSGGGGGGVFNLSFSSPAPAPAPAPANEPETIKLSSFDTGAGSNGLTSLGDIGAKPRVEPERPLTEREIMKEKYE